MKTGKQQQQPRLSLSEEPTIRVGLWESVPRLRLGTSAWFMANGNPCGPGTYETAADHGTITLSTEAGIVVKADEHMIIEPLRGDAITVYDMPIGRSFHWERLQEHQYRGRLLCQCTESGCLRLINEIPLEQYLESVVSSEMSPDAPFEFLRAHCIVSRSWLLAQILRKTTSDATKAHKHKQQWTDATVHRHFDVCNDDHCQRYHGIGRVNTAAQQALEATRGQVLMYGGEICDARFSKCCGGITEAFSTAWDDREVPYLQPCADCATSCSDIRMQISDEESVERFIHSNPAAYCNVTDRALLARILPDVDRETLHFFRWRLDLTQEELQEILREKTGIDFGDIINLEPLARGASGRIYRLRVHGTKADEVFGKELEIRRILSRSHLYSSAFVVKSRVERGTVPSGFTLYGAGWGHGVGMCQIGAAAMAALGYDCKDILHHYFNGTHVLQLYP
ncbi:MAG: SpoIID/LytB domain-containing protein [Desulfobacterota bacterium]|nr:SpoIID/LytB domain-containing protein [Thermodesulfobacteriota bacterium]